MIFFFFIVILDYVLDMYMEIFRGEYMFCFIMDIVKFYVFYIIFFKVKISLENLER